MTTTEIYEAERSEEERRKVFSLVESETESDETSDDTDSS
jgi:hypothetical protein